MRCPIAMVHISCRMLDTLVCSGPGTSILVTRICNCGDDDIVHHVAYDGIGVLWSKSPTELARGIP